MVSTSCKMIVREELKKLGVHCLRVKLGEAEIIENINLQQKNHLQSALMKYGLELIEDKKKVLIEKIKNVVVEMVHLADELPQTKFSCYLSKKLNHNYTYLANVFSKNEGKTIEHFILRHKIEKVKELIIYDELNLTEIAWKLNYSSVAHLSNQFKKVTGLTPTLYRQQNDKNRIAIESL